MSNQGFYADELLSQIDICFIVDDKNKKLTMKDGREKQVYRLLSRVQDWLNDLEQQSKELVIAENEINVLNYKIGQLKGVL